MIGYRIKLPLAGRPFMEANEALGFEAGRETVDMEAVAYPSRPMTKLDNMHCNSVCGRMNCFTGLLMIITELHESTFHEAPFQLPGPNPLGPRALSTTCMIATTFSSSHLRPTTCTPTGKPFILVGSYTPPTPLTP